MFVSSRRKICFLIVVLGAVLWCSYLQQMIEKERVFDGQESNMFKQSRQKDWILAGQESNRSIQTQQYDVVLSSYMGGGSTLTGMILGWRSDAFYVYEPFWKLSTWTYWLGVSTICRSDRLECRTEESVKRVNATDVFSKRCTPTKAQELLTDIYDCTFHQFYKNIYIFGLTDSAGGPSWKMIKNCGGRKHRRICIKKELPTLCKTASHRVTKVLRYSVDFLEKMLSERQTLKVIHLFRDPRAIINSRVETNWYKKQTKDTDILNNAKILCKKMLFDSKAGKKLQEKFPDRFRFLYYEDLNENPFQKIKMLYTYLGMDLDKRKFPQLKKLSVFSDGKNRTFRQKNTAFWWRKTLNWDLVQRIDTVCADVYYNVGYKPLKNREEMENMSLKSVDIPKEHLW